MEFENDEEEKILREKMKRWLKMKDSNNFVFEVNEEDFEDLVINKSKEVPVIVDFWASWCMPCRMLSPVIESAVKKFNGKVILAKVNVDENPNLAAQFDIMSIPTVVMFKDGEIVDYFVGFIPEEQIIKWIDKNLR